MSKVGESIIRGMEEAVAYAKGDKTKGREHVVHVPEDIDVKAIRERTGMSQRQFADYYGLKVTALQAWEQGAAQARPHNADPVHCAGEESPGSTRGTSGLALA